MRRMITVIATVMVASVAFGQDASDVKDMVQRFLQGARKSSGNTGDKAIEGMIEMVTPEADEQCRQAQRSAVKYLLDPNPQRSQQHFDSMIRAVTGQGEVPTQSIPERGRGPSQPPARSLEIPAGDPGWSQFVLTDSRYKAAEAEVAQKAEIYQPGSQTMKDVLERRRLLAAERGDIALKLLPKCQIVFDDLKADYKNQLAEMKPNHPDMQALDLAIKNYEALKEALVQATRLAYVAKLQPLLAGARVKRGYSGGVFDILDVTVDGIRTDFDTLSFQANPGWEEKLGVRFCQYFYPNRNTYDYCYIHSPEWTADSREVARVLDLARRIPDPMRYLSYDGTKPRDAAQANRLLQVEVNKDSWDPRRVRELVIAGGDINSHDEKTGWSPAHHAARWNDSELMKLVVDKGANLESRAYGGGWTPLMYAAFHGHDGMVRALVAAGADVNAVENKNQTQLPGLVNTRCRSVLHIAAYTNNSETVAILLNAKARVNARLYNRGETFERDVGEKSHTQTPLHTAILRSGSRDIVRLLLEAGADVNATTSETEDCLIDRTTSTPLRLAAKKGDAELARLLLSKGGNVDTEGPLWDAAKAGNTDLVRVLLNAGAKPDCEREGETPLIVAAEAGSSQIVSLLLRAGAQVDRSSKHSQGLPYTALMRASYRSGQADTAEKQREYVDTVKALINAGANVNASFMHTSGLCKYTVLTSTMGASYFKGSLHNPENMTGARQEIHNLLRASGARE